MICPYCSCEMPEISAFCPGCGRSVKSAEDPSPTVPQAPGSTGFRDTLLGVVAYIAIVPAIVLLSIPSLGNTRFIRFHAWQSLFFAITSIVGAALERLIFAILPAIPYVGFLLAWLSVGLVFMAIALLWVVLVAKAAMGEAYELPWLGEWAARFADKEIVR